MSVGRTYLAVSILMVVIVFGLVCGAAALVSTQSSSVAHSQKTHFDSGWIDVTSKCGQSFDIFHNLNSTSLRVDILGKTTLRGGVLRNLGLHNTTGWSKTYGGVQGDYANSGIQTSDGGYMLVGSTGNPERIWVVKTDWTGAVSWTKIYPASWGVSERASSVVQTDDGGFTMAGWTNSLGNGDFLLLKTDANGNIQWKNNYGGAQIDFAECVIRTFDGGYAIAGWTESFGTSRDGYFVKTDENGTLQWSRVYGGTGSDGTNSVVQTSEGGYAIAGGTNSSGTGEHFWLVKADPSGTQIWSKTYGVPSAWAKCVIQTSDSGYAMVGVGSPDFIKTDASGDQQFAFSYPGELECVIQTRDGGYALGGINKPNLIKTDDNGIMQWSRSLGGEGWNSVNSVMQTSDGGYTIAGSTTSVGAGSWDFWLVKVDNEFGLAWTDSTANTITLYRGAMDAYWNYVRVRVWKIRQEP